MCVGIPMRIERVEGFRARCRAHTGEARSVDLALVGDQPEGTWLLVFLDTAREVLDPQRARQIHEALAAVDAVMSGETAVDHLFADLVDREPPLPEHLRHLVKKAESEP
jgi:hydrogenase assembly chaperone HypC/HupF